jgi:hypothetical protein
MRFVALGTAALIFSAALVSVQADQAGQTAAPAAERPQLSQEVFKNVQLLRGIPVKEFMGTMGFFAASTGMNCTECHGEESGTDWAKYADETDRKRTARRMIVMVGTINQMFFGGRPVVSCYSCHRGSARPQVIPNLAVQYGDAIIVEPDEVPEQASDQPTADQIFDKYIQAIGGAQRVAGINSYVARGMYMGFDDYQMFPVEVYGKSPGQRATIMHGGFGDITWIYDGANGWVRTPKETSPVPVLPVTGGDASGFKAEAQLAFPAQLKQLLTDWRVGVPAMIDDREVRVVQGRPAGGGPPMKLYFDPMTGLLVRFVYYNDTPVGRIPTQIDYSDYRDVAGVKMPFKWTTTWTNGRMIFEIDSVQLNVPIDAGKFAKPAPPG